MKIGNGREGAGLPDWAMLCYAKVPAEALSLSQSMLVVPICQVTIVVQSGIIKSIAIFFRQKPKRLQWIDRLFLIEFNHVKAEERQGEGLPAPGPPPTGAHKNED